VQDDPIAGLQLVAPRLRLVHLYDTPLETWRHHAVGRGGILGVVVAATSSTSGSARFEKRYFGLDIAGVFSACWFQR
jgi:hypothetical protein